jgi:hypothetical protein
VFEESIFEETAAAAEHSQNACSACIFSMSSQEFLQLPADENAKNVNLTPQTSIPLDPLDDGTRRGKLAGKETTTSSRASSCRRCPSLQIAR